MEHIRKEQTTATTSSLNNLMVVKPVGARSQIRNQRLLSPKIEIDSNDGIGTKMDKLINILTEEEMIKDTEANQKKWKIPFKWKRKMNKSSKPASTDKVLCLFINKKGELDPPVLLPIYNGNTLVYKYTIHEVDPRDIITLHQKRRSYKLLIYRLMDRKAISNRDYAEVKKKGDSTIDDEVFIKAMLTAKASQVSKQQIGKGALIIGGLVIAGIIIWFFSKS